MNNARKGREAAQRGTAMAGYQINLAMQTAEHEQLTHPMMLPTKLRSPRAKRRDIMGLSNAEVDAILAGPEPEER